MSTYLARPTRVADLRVASTLMPKDLANRATSRPILPKPTIPTVCERNTRVVIRDHYLFCFN